MLRSPSRRALTVLLLSFASASAVSAEPVAPRFLPFGDLPGDRDRSAPVAVSTDGSSVIGNGVSPAGPEAFRWTAATGAVGLGDLPGGGFFSVARAATPDGSTVAGVSASEVGVEPFRWTEATGMQALVPFGAGDGCAVAAISRGGDAVAGTCRVKLPFNEEPFPTAWVWTAANGFAWPAGFPGYGKRSGAQTVSDDGRTLFGWIENDDQNPFVANRREAVRFEAGADGVFRTADDRHVVLDRAFDVDPEIPLAASADGRKAVGVGERRGQPYAFLWSAGADRRAGTADDSFRSILWRGTTAICLPLGISANGRTPFGACSGATGPIFPARWDASKGWVRLGAAPLGSQGGYAVGASADGRTLVGFFEVQRGPAPWDLAFKPFRWTAAGGLSVFSTVTPETEECERCIVVSSDGGDVLGAERGPRGDGFFLWTAGRGRRHLEELPGDWRTSSAYALSDDGLVAAGKSRSTDGDRAFRWTEEIGTTPVGPAGVRGMDVTLSDDGATLLGVARWDLESRVARTAFFHRAATDAVESLGPGFAGTTSCYPSRLSGDGSTIVGDCIGGVQDPAFRWTAETGVVPLQLPTDHNDWWCVASAVSRTGASVGMTCSRPIGGATAESRALLWSGLGVPLRALSTFSGDRRQLFIDLSSDASVALGELEGVTPSEREGFVWSLARGRIPWVYAGIDQAVALDLTPDGRSALFQSDGVLRHVGPLTTSAAPLPSPSPGVAGPVRGGLLSADASTAVAMYERLGPPRAPHLGPATRIWLWDAANGGRWLDDALTAGGVDLGGWSLEEVVDVSADGKRLLGNGLDPEGRAQAWLVVLP